MRCFKTLSFSLISTLLLITSIPNVASVHLASSSQAFVGASTLVFWNREPSDPVDLSFDLRFVQDTFSDVGLAKANVVPSANQQFGELDVVFPKAGKYVLKAVMGSPRNIPVGSSNEIEAIQMPSSTTASPTSTSSPTPTSSQPPSTGTSVPSPVKAAQRSINLPAIVGGLIGALIFLGLLAALIVYLSRRRKSSPWNWQWKRSQAIAKRFTFHKDMMQRPRRVSDTPTIPAPAEGRATMITPYPYPVSARPTVDTMDVEAQRYTPSIVTDTCAISPLVIGRRGDADLERGLQLPSTTPTSASPGSALPSATIRPPVSATPMGTGHIVPSPRGPRPSMKRNDKDGTTKGSALTSTTTPTTGMLPGRDSVVPLPPLTIPAPVFVPGTASIPFPGSAAMTLQSTRRQQEIRDRMSQLQAQMTELEKVMSVSPPRPNGAPTLAPVRASHNGGLSPVPSVSSPSSGSLYSSGETHPAVLGDMQRQMVWLSEQENGPWALGRTDTLPPGFARYMTP